MKPPSRVGAMAVSLIHSLSRHHWGCCIWPLGELGRADELAELRGLAIDDPDSVADRVLQFPRDCVRIVDERVGMRLP